MASKADSQRRWRQKHLTARRDYQRKHRAENPAAMKARAAINNRIYRGQMTRPERPLAVRWLCRPCHAGEDRKQRSLATEGAGVKA